MEETSASSLEVGSSIGQQQLCNPSPSGAASPTTSETGSVRSYGKRMLEQLLTILTLFLYSEDNNLSRSELFYNILLIAIHSLIN